MKLTKNHIGKFFVCRGADGSWAYLLVDVKAKDLLFFAIPRGVFEIESRRHRDWMPYELNTWLPGEHTEYSKKVVTSAWETARRTK